MKLIGISGKAGYGKTTFATHAIRTYGGTKIALASALKDEVAEFLTSCLVPFEARHLYGATLDRSEFFEVAVRDWLTVDYRVRRILNPYLTTSPDGQTVSMTYRQLLQLWGTNYRRAQDPDYWVIKTRDKILKTEGLVFIDDIRFESEVNMVKDLHGVLVRLERPGGPFIDTPWHESETALDGYKGWNYEVFNGGSLEEFKVHAASVVAGVIL
jgi:hypothetical protein